MSFRNFTTGNNHSFGGEYIELVPHERLRYTDKFDDPNLPGQIQVTVTLKKVSQWTAARATAFSGGFNFSRPNSILMTSVVL